MQPTFISADSFLGILGSLGLMLATFLAKKYIIPFLQVGKRQKYAEYIATIADDLIDNLRLKYPDKTWLEHLDEVVDTLVAICGITPEIAKRALQASAARK